MEYTEFKRKYGYKNDAVWSFYYRYIKRPITIPLCWLLYQTSIMPNTLTFFGLIVAFFSAYSFSQGTFIGFLGGVLLLELFNFSDDFDGVIARAKKLSSRHGAWLDSLFGTFGMVIIFIGMTLGVYNQLGNSFWLKVGLVLIMGYTFRFFIEKETRIHFIKEEFKKTMPTAEESSLQNMTLKKFLSIIVETADNSWHILIYIAVFSNRMPLYLIASATYYILLTLFSFSYYYYLKRGE